MLHRLIGGIILAMLALAPASADGPTRKVTVVFDHALPNVPGKSMKGVLVEYGPGASSPAHTHPAQPSSTRQSLRARFASRSMAAP